MDNKIPLAPVENYNKKVLFLYKFELLL